MLSRPFHCSLHYHKMDILRGLLVLSLFGAALCEKVPDFTIVEKIWSPKTHAQRLVAEDFTRGMYTVPGYSAKETEEPSEPPFYPMPECSDEFLNLTDGAFGTITSPNYPDRYSSNLNCEWNIEGIPGTVVEATFFDIVTQPWLFGFSDFVSVSETGSWESYRRFAGDANHKMPFVIISKENRLSIRLVTSRFLNFRGFKMSYIVRPMKASDTSPAINEYGSAFNNDLVAVCSSKPIQTDRQNSRFKVSNPEDIMQNIEHARIVNGVETLPHQYPFMVIILTNQGAFCGGSLIDPNHVLTAAHCLQLEDDNEVEELQSIDMVFGVYNLSNRAENLYARQFRSVQYPDIGSNVFIHPHYDSRSGANDIAIIRVNKVKITKYVQQVFLPSVYTESNSFTSWTLRVLGWGSATGETSQLRLEPVIRSAPATVLPTVQCKDHFHGSVSGNHICTRNPFVRPEEPTPVPIPSTTQESIASTSEVTTNTTADDEASAPAPVIEYQSPCHGDSGGPLLAEFIENHSDEEVNPNNAGPSLHDCVNAKQNGGATSVKLPADLACDRPQDTKQTWYVQVGVLSFGSRVCGRKVPVVYTRVAAHLQWIFYITGRHG